MEEQLALLVDCILQALCVRKAVEISCNAKLYNHHGVGVEGRLSVSQLLVAILITFAEDIVVFAQIHITSSFLLSCFKVLLRSGHYCFALRIGRIDAFFLSTFPISHVLKS